MTIAEPEVLVLMAVYNGEEWLSAQIDSILAQEAVSIRLVISIDRSSDSSRAICERYASQDQRVNVLSTDTSHGSATKNFLFLTKETDAGSASYVAFSDQDDIWDLDKLRRSIDEMQRREVAAVSSDVVAFWPDGTRRLIIKSQPQKKFDFVLEAAGPGSTYLISRQLWMGFREWLADRRDIEMPPHDWLIYAYARIYGHPWHIMPQSTVLYRQHRDNFLGANLGFKGRLARIKSIKSGAFRADVERLARAFGDDFPLSVSKGALLSKLFTLRRKRSEAIIFGLLCALFW